MVVLSVLIIALLTIILLKKQDSNDGTFRILQEQLEHLRNAVENKLDRSSSDLHKVLHQQSSDSHRIIG